MPRPKRARPVAPSPANNTTSNDSHDEEQTRGRSRTTRSSGLSLGMSERETLKSANQSRDAALERLANDDATTTGDDTQEMEVGRRDTGTPMHARDITGLDLADSVDFDLDESFEIGHIPTGGRSADNSSYHLSHIKPRSRSRQSSIMGRSDHPIRPSSRSGATPLVSSSFNIGAFRRRAREPSILGTGRKTHPDATTTTLQNEDSGSDDDDFAPEAESTPVNNRRRTRHSIRHEQEVKIPSDEQVTSSAAKKRKNDDEVVDESERPQKVRRSGGSASPRDSDSDSELSSLSSPPAMPLDMVRPVTPLHNRNEEEAASPMSSGSEEQGEWPDIRGLVKRRRRASVTDPLNADILSDISSPPSLTHSPNHNEHRAMKTRGRSTTRRQASPKLTTADLAKLLPQRHIQRARSPVDGDSDEELDTAGLGQDEDELHHLDASRRRKQGSRPDSRATSRGGRRAQPALKEKETPAMNTRRATRYSQTYSRHSSDKENRSEDGEEDGEEEESRFVPLPEDSFTGEAGDISILSASNELNQAKAKFKDVDRWELEFEEASEPPSPAGAR